jgi:phosphoenolpyruvate carboxykinase (ATP)
MAQPQQQETGLEGHGIVNVARVYWNLSIPALYEEAVRRREALISVDGPLVCRTGQHTGRSPNDKFIVREPSSEDKVWWSKVNRAIDGAQFDAVHQRMLNYCEGKELFVQDCYAGADPGYRLPVRIITEQAWHSLFARHMFIDVPGAGGGPVHTPEFTVIDMPGLTADPKVHGTNSEVFVLLNFEKKLVLIGGTSYAGEIKKSIFTVMNYLLPLRNVMSMHCSANVGSAGDTALFFGLSGTGKTTLSSDPDRQLIGDDEHGWSEAGIFNIEGGCYAKMIKLSAEAEPQIYATTRRFGTVLENVRMDAGTRHLDLDDASLTETRAGHTRSSSSTTRSRRARVGIPGTSSC